MLLADGMAASVVFAAGAAIASYFLIRRSRQYLARSRSDTAGSPRGEPTNHAHRHDEIASEAMRARVELEETARDLMGELNSKMSALQALIQMADAAAERLEAAADRAERSRARSDQRHDEP